MVILKFKKVPGGSEEIMLDLGVRQAKKMAEMVYSTILQNSNITNIDYTKLIESSAVQCALL